MAVNPTQFKDSSNEQRIERRFPGGWSSVLIKRIAKASTRDQRAPDTAHLKTKTEIILDGFEFVAVRDHDVGQSQSKSDYHHPKKRSPNS